jgi:hypothetical protein
LADRHLVHRVGGQHLQGRQRRRVDEGTDRDVVHLLGQLVDATLGLDNRSVPGPELLDGCCDGRLCGLELRELLLHVGLDPIERLARGTRIAAHEAGLDADQGPAGGLGHPAGVVVAGVLLDGARGRPGCRGGDRWQEHEARDHTRGRPAPPVPTDIPNPSTHLGT